MCIKDMLKSVGPTGHWWLTDISLPPSVVSVTLSECFCCTYWQIDEAVFLISQFYLLGHVFLSCSTLISLCQMSAFFFFFFYLHACFRKITSKAECYTVNTYNKQNGKTSKSYREDVLANKYYHINLRVSYWNCTRRKVSFPTHSETLKKLTWLSSFSMSPH